MVNKINDGKGGVGNFFKKAGSGIMKGANAISHAVGGDAIADKIGAKLAKAYVSKEKRKFVEDKTSAWDAVKSAASVGMAAATPGAAVGAVKLGLGAAKLAPRAIGATKAVLKKGVVKSVVGAYRKSHAKKTVANILKKHKSGGDAKMLDTMRKSDGAYEGLPKKLPVKSNPEYTSRFENNRTGILKPEVKLTGSSVRKLPVKSSSPDFTPVKMDNPTKGIDVNRIEKNFIRKADSEAKKKSHLLYDKLSTRRRLAKERGFKK